ncbi:unnamed protein product [Polarella glacialis]|uniref:Uncharacterized protein n=1 Tax=Polarella glacialis TaxID=89957 RepID=A0A813DF05_POLGL|nr:unnamed protein product [Polarella glacialis]
MAAGVDPVAGTILAVRYNVAGRVLYHERVVTGKVPNKRLRYMILTPDGEHYDEDYEDSQDFDDVLVLRAPGELPAGMLVASFYRFPVPVAAGALAFRAGQAQVAIANDPRLAGAMVPVGGGGGGGGPAAVHLPLAAPAQPAAGGAGGAVLGMAGGGAAVNAGVPAAAAVPAAAPLLGQWRVAAAEAGSEVGDLVPAALAPAGAGIKRIAMVNGNETFIELVQDDNLNGWIDKRLPLDVRIQRIKVRHGARCCEWREAVEDLREETFADFPLSGPRTSGFCLRYLNRQPGGAADRRILWRQGSKVNPSDWGVSEHETLLEAVKLASSYDQLELTNLACFEIVFRRLQTIEYCYQDRSRELNNTQRQKWGPKLTLEEQSAFMGVTRNEMVMIDPQLLSHIKTHVKEDAELAKNLRLARDELAAAFKNKKNEQE